MKKLLLLALTIGSATALTACGGAEKAVDTFLERHINVETQNFTVAYSGKTINVDGNMVQNTTDSNVFDMNLDGKTAAWLKDTYYEYTPTEGSSYTSGYQDIIVLDSLTEAEVKSTDAAAYQAYVGPFAQLVAAQSDVLDDKELSSKFFSTEKDEDGNETVYFVVDKETTAATSPMTMEFTYELNDNEKETDEFKTVTVVYNGNTWVYSNLTNASEGVSDEDVKNVIEVATPATTLFEELAIAASTMENIKVSGSIPYTSETDSTITSQTVTVQTSTTEEDVKYFYVNTQYDGSYYAIENADGTFQVYTKCTISGYTSYYVISTEDTLSHVDALQTVLTANAVKAEEMNKVSSYYNWYYTEGNLEYNVYVREFKHYGEFSVTITDTSGDTNTTFLTAEDYSTDLSSTVSGLSIYNTVLAEYTDITSTSSSNTTQNITVVTYDTDGTTVLNTTYYIANHETAGEVCLVIDADGSAELTRTYTGTSTYKYDEFFIDADMNVSIEATGVTNSISSTIYTSQYVRVGYSDLTWDSTAGAFYCNKGEDSHKHELFYYIGATVEESYTETYNWDYVDGARTGEYLKYTTTVNSATETINTYLAAIATYEAANA